MLLSQVASYPNARTWERTSAIMTESSALTPIFPFSNNFAQADQDTIIHWTLVPACLTLRWIYTAYTVISPGSPTTTPTLTFTRRFPIFSRALKIQLSFPGDI